MLLGKFSLLQMAKHGSNNLAIWSHWTNNAGSVEIVEPFLFATVNGLVAIDKYFTKNMNSVSFSFLIFKICECFKSSKYHWFAFTERTMLTVFLKKICANPASFCLFHPFYQYNDKYSSRFAYIKAWMVSLEFEPGAAVWYAMVAPICNANSCFKSDSLITDCEAVHSENIHRRRKDHCADFQFY